MRTLLRLLVCLSLPALANAQSEAVIAEGVEAADAPTSAPSEAAPATLLLLPLLVTGVDAAATEPWSMAMVAQGQAAGHTLVGGSLTTDLLSRAGGCLEPECLLEIGLAYRVPLVVAGRLSRMQDKLLVHIKMFDVTARKTIRRAYETLDAERMTDPSLMQTVLASVIVAPPVASDTGVPSNAEPVPLADFEGADDPVILQALALEAEVDGDSRRALDKLRKAIALDPNDTSVAFDLARIALHGDGGGFAADAAPFLALDPPTPDAKLLRAHILVRRGQRDDAAVEVAHVLAARPADSEALKLQARLGRRDLPTETARRVSASVTSAVLYDSNVLVLPEALPSQEAGLRGGLGGSVSGRFGLGALRLDAGGFFRASAHATNRVNLNAYDSMIGGASLGARYAIGELLLRLDANHSQIFLDLVGTHFMQATGGRLEASMPVGPVRVSVYARGTFRDFIDPNEAVEGLLDDRDGPRLVVGAAARWRRGVIALRAGGGYMTELAQGERQEVRGGVAQVRASLRLKPVRLSVGSSYEYRHYWKFRRGTKGVTPHKRRTDHRFTPNVRVTVPVFGPVSAQAAYSLMINDSRRAFAYTRHVGQLGVKASW